MHQGRERGQTRLAPTDLGGVRNCSRLSSAAKSSAYCRTKCPANGEGEWVSFFGRPAYTMTLIGRLIESSGAAVVMCHSERRPRGEGYALHFSPMSFVATASIPKQMNTALEAVIRDHPEQYLWSYNRYKVPRGALPPDLNKDS